MTPSTMFRHLFIPIAIVAGTLCASEISELDHLRAGARMVKLEVPRGKKLVGTAPAGEGAPFYILDGSKILKKLSAGESFEQTVYANNVYLLSENADNLNWDSLRWVATRQYPAKTGRHLRIKGDGSSGWGAPKADGTDAGPQMRELIGNATWHGRCGSAVTIDLPKGEYHFYPEGALKMSYYISNHDQRAIQPVGLPIVGQKKLTINGNGSTFIFHGAMQPILVMDSAQVRLNDITIRHENPYYNEGKIVEITEGSTTLEFPEQFKWQVKNGQYYLMGDGTPRASRAALPFEADGRMVATGKNGDIPWPAKCEQVDHNKVRFFNDTTKFGLKKGQILVVRHYARPHPAMVLYRANSISLNNVVFQDSQGMALIAQRSKDITINGGGCICAEGRVYTASADATHFSNCAGTITVKGAHYEGMMDDAINVHSTCLGIEKVISPTEIIARYMHPQAVGFEVFEPGERIQFINGPTLENHPQLGKALRVQKVDEQHLRIQLAKPLPHGIGEGDAIENADWYPAVNFIGCTVQHNRARGTLFTTPKPVLVQDCKFIGCSGSAILLAGDAQGWYESGRCTDVKIKNNLFEHNLIQRYQFTEGIISIYPMVNEPEAQKERYHKNIIIENNTFRTHRVPLIYAISADNIIFRNNRVLFDNRHAPMHKNQPYVLKHCGKTDLQKL